jgi:hypothetical protein
MVPRAGTILKTPSLYIRIITYLFLWISGKIIFVSPSLSATIQIKLWVQLWVHFYG